MKRVLILSIICVLLMTGCIAKTDEKPETATTITATQTTITSVQTSVQETTALTEETTTPTTEKTTQKVTTTTKAITFTDVQKTFYAANNGSIRTAPDDNAKIESRMKPGEEIYVISSGDNGWDKVKYKDQIRYVWHDNLSQNKPTTAAPKKEVADYSGTTSKGYSLEIKNGKTYVDGLLIANKSYSLPSTYNPGGLLSECDKAYDKMDAAAAKAGYDLYISSGFRSYATQESIYNRYVANDGKANADRYSARPGYSEHQTGLAIDLNGVSDNFGNTATGKWVAAHCHEYGFIIRYPKGKEAQTGYMYEPWHIRYVGVEKATKIYNSGLCLEEYYGITSQYE